MGWSWFGKNMKKKLFENYHKIKDLLDLPLFIIGQYGNGISLVSTNYLSSLFQYFFSWLKINHSNLMGNGLKWGQSLIDEIVES